MSTTKAPTKRQLVESARNAALSGDWLEAERINREIIEREKKDAEACNRLGRALLEQADYAGAYEAYQGAFKADPANMIARRNLRRPEYLRAKKGGAESGAERPEHVTIPRASDLIEEVGKTWVDELVHPLPMTELAAILPGEQLELEMESDHLYITDFRGKRLGEIEPRTAERIIELLRYGYRYEVFALGLANASLRVILREVYRDPSLGGRVSFPRQISRASRYLREREALRLRDEADFLPDYEDDELEEDEVTRGATDEEDATPADAFEEEEAAAEEEESELS